jgi:glyoxylase I family protein
MVEAREDIVREEDKVLDLVAGVTLEPADHEAAARARRDNKIEDFDHLAFACRNVAETRIFYEDILGLPLVLTLILQDPFRNDGARYCHFFFEIGHGNFIAFFDHEAMFKPEDFDEESGFHHHIAMKVASDDIVQDYRQRLMAAGIEAHYVDHGFYHSLYFTDPNGINLEITHKLEHALDFEAKMRKVARPLLDSWTAEKSAGTDENAAAA